VEWAETETGPIQFGSCDKNCVLRDMIGTTHPSIYAESENGQDGHGAMDALT
jgi:hypothetical protein